MQKIDLYKSSQLTAQNNHRVVMIDDFNDAEKKNTVAIGNCFVSKSNKKVPKRLLTTDDVEEYKEHIEFICYY